MKDLYQLEGLPKFHTLNVLAPSDKKTYLDKLGNEDTYVFFNHPTDNMEDWTNDWDIEPFCRMINEEYLEKNINNTPWAMDHSVLWYLKDFTTYIERFSPDNSFFLSRYTSERVKHCIIYILKGKIEYKDKVMTPENNNLLFFVNPLFLRNNLPKVLEETVAIVTKVDQW